MNPSRTLSGKPKKPGFGAPDWLTLVRPPSGKAAVCGVRNADRIPAHIRNVPNPADLRVTTEAFTGLNRAEARARGGRRRGYSTLARLREFTPERAKAEHRSRIHRAAKALRRLTARAA